MADPAAVLTVDPAAEDHLEVEKSSAAAEETAADLLCTKSHAVSAGQAVKSLSGQQEAGRCFAIIVLANKAAEETAADRQDLKEKGTRNRVLKTGKRTVYLLPDQL